MKIKLIAMLCHQVNKVYCESLGDHSQLFWDELLDWQKESALDGVMYALEDGVTPEQLHELWMKTKLKDGWVFGQEKDCIKKTHPCLIEYSKLGEDQKTKDKLFLTVVNHFKNNDINNELFISDIQSRLEKCISDLNKN